MHLFSTLYRLFDAAATAFGVVFGLIPDPGKTLPVRIRIEDEPTHRGR
jgi:hypothetical protein